MAPRHLPVFSLLAAGLACALAGQSPIDIRDEKATPVSRPPLEFKHYHSSRNSYFLSNTGHGVQITLQNRLYSPKIRGGPLASVFILEQIHFHWGETDGIGSEHRLNGAPFSMEAHLVHWNSKYKTYKEASTKPDGLAVIGFFLECADCLQQLPPDRRRRLFCRSGRRRNWLQELMCTSAGEKAWKGVSSVMSRFLPRGVNVRIRSKLFPTGRETRNSAFQQLVNVIPKVARRASDKVEVEANLLAWAVPHLQPYNYYTYKGSLTTEPFSENVNWIVYKDPILIEKAQIAAFRGIENEHSELLKTNFRGLQDATNTDVKYVPDHRKY